MVNQNNENKQSGGIPRRTFLELFSLYLGAAFLLAACGGKDVTSSFQAEAGVDSQPPERLYPVPESIFNIFVDGSVAFYTPDLRRFEELKKQGIDALDGMYAFFGKHMDDPTKNMIIDSILYPGVDSHFPAFEKIEVNRWLEAIAVRFSPDGLFIVTKSDISRRADPIGVGVAVLGYGSVTPDRIEPSSSPPLKDQSIKVKEQVIQICANAVRPARVPAQGIVVPDFIQEDLSAIIKDPRGKKDFYAAFYQIFERLEKDNPEKLQQLLQYRESVFNLFATTYGILSGTAFSEEWIGFENLESAFSLPAGTVKGIYGYEIMPTNILIPGTGNYQQTINVLLERIEGDRANVSSVPKLYNATPEFPVEHPPKVFVAAPHHFMVPFVGQLDL